MAIHVTAHDGNMMLFPYLTNSVHQIFESFFIMHKTVCEDLANILSARQIVFFFLQWFVWLFHPVAVVEKGLQGIPFLFQKLGSRRINY